MKFFELIDVESGNWINTFDSEEEALAAGRELIELNGDAYANRLAYGWGDDEDEDEEAGAAIAGGAELLERVRKAEPARSGAKA